MYCLECMNEYEGDKCPVCGSNRVLNQVETNPSSSLDIQTRLGPDKNYVVGLVANEKNNVVTYHAYDKVNKKPVLVKEYFSKNCIRLQSGGVEIPESEKEGFLYYKDKVNGLKFEYHQSNSRPIDYFEQNDTFYAIFDYKKPEPFFKYLKNNRIENPKEFVKPLLEIIKIYHAKGFTVGIDKLGVLDGTLVLNDFSGKKTSMQEDIKMFLKTLSSCKLNHKANDIAEAKELGLSEKMTAEDCFSVLYENKTIKNASEGTKSDIASENEDFEDEDFEDENFEDEDADDLSDDLVEEDEKIKKKKFSFKKKRKHCERFKSEQKEDIIKEDEAENITSDDFETEDDDFEENDFEDDFEAEQKRKKVKMVIGVAAGVMIVAMLFSNVSKNLSAKHPQKTPIVTNTIKPTIKPTLAPVSTPTLSAIDVSESTDKEDEDKDKYCIVPDIENMQKNKAEKVLKNDGIKLKVKAYRYDSSVKKGYIIKQNKKFGTQVRKGSVIKVNVSKGKKKPKKSANKTVTVPKSYKSYSEPSYSKPSYSVPKSNHYTKHYSKKSTKPKTNSGSPVIPDPIQ